MCYARFRQIAALLLCGALVTAPRSHDIVRIAKTSDRVTEITGTFAASRHVLFEAITTPEHLKQWMSASGMTLAEAHVDAHADGSFRYVFQRKNGKRLEVRGAIQRFDPPSTFTYVETYDFSPLRIDVTTALEQTGGATKLTQILRYASQRDRDEDFEGVATSSRESYAKLASYLATR